MSRHKERLGRLVAWLQKHSDMRTPLLAFHGSTSPGLPDTSQDEIEAARAEGRMVANIRFVKADPRVMNREGESASDCAKRELGSEPSSQFTPVLPGAEK